MTTYTSEAAASALTAKIAGAFPQIRVMRGYLETVDWNEPEKRIVVCPLDSKIERPARARERRRTTCLVTTSKQLESPDLSSDVGRGEIDALIETLCKLQSFVMFEAFLPGGDDRYFVERAETFGGRLYDPDALAEGWFAGGLLVETVCDS